MNREEPEAAKPRRREPHHVRLPGFLTEDLDLLIEISKRPLSSTEFDVVKGQVIGRAPPALCNA
jgi:hypothetical protein